jgi:hypothetical protein
VYQSLKLFRLSFLSNLLLSITTFLSTQVKTAVVVACLRKRQGWSLSSVMAEFEAFSESDDNSFDMLFIESYQSTK